MSGFLRAIGDFVDSIDEKAESSTQQGARPIIVCMLSQLTVVGVRAFATSNIAANSSYKCSTRLGSALAGKRGCTKHRGHLVRRLCSEA